MTFFELKSRHSFEEFFLWCKIYVLKSDDFYFIFHRPQYGISNKN